MLAGVCSGLGEYFGIDPVFIRLAAALLFVYRFWLGLVVYAAATFLIPERDSADYMDAEVVDHPSGGGIRSQLWVALALILTGSGLLFYRFCPWTPSLSRYLAIFRQFFWPAVLIGLGLWLIFGRKNK